MEKSFLHVWMTLLKSALFLLIIQAVIMPSQTWANHPAKSSSYDTSLWAKSTVDIWDTLQPLSSAKLLSLLKQERDPVRLEWLRLVLISKQQSNQTKQLAQALLSWQEKNPTHPANELLPDSQALNQLLSAKPPLQIAVLLPLSGAYAASGQKVRAGFIQAYYENFPHEDNQTIRFYDTSPSTDVNQLYKKAIADGADFVIGPLVKSNVSQLTSVGEYQTPTLALNYTDLHVPTLPDNFYEFGLMPDDEALQLASHARNEEHERAIIIAPENEWGKHLVNTFSASWSALGGHITETWYFSAHTDFNRDIAHLLGIDPDDHERTHEPVRRQDFDVIFLFAQPLDARMIVPLLRFNYANDATVYATSSVYTGKTSLETNVDLNGVIICDIPRDKQATSDIESQRLRAVGRDAYLLSQSLPRLQLLPHFAIYAATGALILTPQHQIRRHVPCSAVHTNELS